MSDRQDLDGSDDPSAEEALAAAAPLAIGARALPRASASPIDGGNGVAGSGFPIAARLLPGAPARGEIVGSAGVVWLAGPGGIPLSLMAVPEASVGEMSLIPAPAFPSVNGRPQSRRRRSGEAQFAPQGDPMAPAAASIMRTAGVGVRDAGEGRGRETPRSAERAVSSGAGRSRAVTTDPPAGAPAPAQGEPQQGSGTPSGGKLTPRQAMERLLSSNPRPTMAVVPAPEVQGNQDGSLRTDPPAEAPSRPSRTEAGRTAVTAAPAWPGTDSGSAREPSPIVGSTPVVPPTSAVPKPAAGRVARPAPSAEPGAGELRRRTASSAIAAEAAVPSTVSPVSPAPARTPGRGASESTSRSGSGPERIEQPLPASSWPTDDARPTATGDVPAAGPVSARQALINRLLEREAQRGGRPTFAASRPAPSEPSAPPSLGSPPSTPSASAPAPTSSVPPSAAAPAVPVPDTPLPGLAPNASSTGPVPSTPSGSPATTPSRPTQSAPSAGSPSAAWPGDTPGPQRIPEAGARPGDRFTQDATREQADGVLSDSTPTASAVNPPTARRAVWPTDASTGELATDTRPATVGESSQLISREPAAGERRRRESSPEEPNDAGSGPVRSAAPTPPTAPSALTSPPDPRYRRPGTAPDRAQPGALGGTAAVADRPERSPSRPSGSRLVDTPIMARADDASAGVGARTGESERPPAGSPRSDSAPSFSSLSSPSPVAATTAAAVAPPPGTGPSPTPESDADRATVGLASRPLERGHRNLDSFGTPPPLPAARSSIRAPERISATPIGSDRSVAARGRRGAAPSHSGAPFVRRAPRESERGVPADATQVPPVADAGFSTMQGGEERTGSERAVTQQASIDRRELSAPNAGSPSVAPPSARPTPRSPQGSAPRPNDDRQAPSASVPTRSSSNARPPVSDPPSPLPSRPESLAGSPLAETGRPFAAAAPRPPVARVSRPVTSDVKEAGSQSPVTRPALPYTPLRSQPVEGGTVGRSASARFARTEQRGVLAPSLGGSRPAPPGSVPQQADTRDSARRSSRAAPAPDTPSSDGTIRAADLAARIRGTQAAAPPTGAVAAGGGSRSGNPAGSASPNRGQGSGSSAGDGNRGGARAAGGGSRPATPHISMQSEMIRRAPAGESVDVPDQPAVDVDAIVDEVERRLQRRLRLGFDRRGGLRGGGPSWPM